MGDIFISGLSVIFPILGTIAAGLILYVKQDYDRVQNIRRAFLAELNTVDLPTYVDLGDMKLPVPYSSRLVPNSVYENNTSSIGKLTPEEVSAIVDFYSFADNPEHLKEVMMEHEKFAEDPRWDLTHLEEKKDSAIKNLERES